jgi:transcriptional regulator with XRE-family HTH domain
MNINKSLRNLRKTNSQKETAKNLNIPYANYNKYETSDTMPDIETLTKIANYYNVSLDYLVGRQWNNDIGNINKNQYEFVKLYLELDDADQNKLYGYAMCLKTKNKE